MKPSGPDTGRDGPLASGALDADEALDATLRPRTFGEFVGQERVVGNVRLYIAAARERKEVLDHALFSGPPGLGKTTLATLLARDLGVNLRTTSGPALERPRDLVGLLTDLGEGDVLFIDEIHRIPRAVEEYLYTAMEQYRLHIVIDQGPDARSVEIALKPFTLVGATTREGLLSAPFRSRFGILEKLEPYSVEELTRILARSAKVLSVGADEGALRAVAARSRGTPRVANRFLRRIRDVAQVERRERIDAASVREGMRRLGVSEDGLDATDVRVLEALVRAGGVPVGLKTIAAAIGEEEGTVEEVYEPFLLREGYLLRTARGRLPTLRAFERLGVAAPASTGQPGLFPPEAR
ncbi:MAG: Holliday junction branch migration DNA helicase RuvB [Planctomycetes bacterium]|nr:Holliday junction branch migration DNA helicase RuvB [Planctomycetota bacterium]